jgi:hypothetical protein
MVVWLVPHGCVSISKIAQENLSLGEPSIRHLTYFLQSALIGFGHNYISFNETGEIEGFSGNYFVLPPDRHEWGMEEFIQLSPGKSLDALKETDYFWEAMELE